MSSPSQGDQATENYCNLSPNMLSSRKVSTELSPAMWTKTLEDIVEEPIDEPTESNQAPNSILAFLLQTKQHIVNRQRSRVFFRNKEVTFVNMLTSFFVKSFTAVKTICVMLWIELWNLIPLMDVLLYMMGIIVDELISICEAATWPRKVFKSIIFVAKLMAPFKASQHIFKAFYLTWKAWNKVRSDSSYDKVEAQSSVDTDNLCAAERSYRASPQNDDPIAAPIIPSHFSPSAPIATISKPAEKQQYIADAFEDPHPAAPSRAATAYNRVLCTLRAVREPILDYHESRGFSRNEELTFVSVITSLCLQSYTAAITICVMLWNLIPLVEGMLYLVRFILDRLIAIFECENSKDMAVKTAIFMIELVVVFALVFLVVGLIFIPVFLLTSKLLSKVIGLIW